MQISDLPCDLTVRVDSFLHLFFASPSDLRNDKRRVRNDKCCKNRHMQNSFRQFSASIIYYICTRVKSLSAYILIYQPPFFVISAVGSLLGLS